MERKERQEVRNQIVEMLGKIDDKSLDRKERSSIRVQLVEAFDRIGISMTSGVDQVSTPNFDMIKAGNVTEDSIIEVFEKAYQELLDTGKDETGAIEMLKEPLIGVIDKIDAQVEVVQEATDLNNCNEGSEEDDDDSPTNQEKEELETEDGEPEGDFDEEDETLQESLFQLPVVPKQSPTLSQRGIYFLDQEISMASVAPIIKVIMEHNAAEQKLDHLTLIVASNGGDLEAAFALIDTMKTSEIPIHTVAMGKLKSAALLISMAGEKGNRTIMKHTSVMSHQFRVQPGAQTEADIQAANVKYQTLGGQLDVFYAEHTGLNMDIIKKELRSASDRWLTAEEAIKFGLADKIETGEFFKGAQLSGNSGDDDGSEEIEESVKPEGEETEEDKADFIEESVQNDEPKESPEDEASQDKEEPSETQEEDTKGDTDTPTAA